MKQLALLITIFLLFAFTDSARKDKQPFKVEIAYKDLPAPMTTEYVIDNKKMILNHVIYDNKDASYQSLNKSTFKDFDREKIITYLQNTDWASIAPALGSPTPDGYHYIVKVEINNKAYNFDIQNTYHPVFANLFTICNQAIPDGDKREKYFLPYN